MSNWHCAECGKHVPIASDSVIMNDTTMCLTCYYKYFEERLK